MHLLLDCTKFLYFISEQSYESDYEGQKIYSMFTRRLHYFREEWKQLITFNEIGKVTQLLF